MEVVPLNNQFDLIKIEDTDMEPYLRVKDMVLIEKIENFNFGDIVLFKHPRFNKLMFHRVVNGGFKGDNLEAIDPPFDIEVLGVARYRLINSKDSIRLANLQFKLSSQILALLSTSGNTGFTLGLKSLCSKIIRYLEDQNSVENNILDFPTKY